MVSIISRCIGRMAAGIAGSAYYRHSHSNPIAKRIATRIYPTATYHHAPFSNPLIQSLASRIYPIGRAFFDTAYKMMKSWLPKMPLLASFTYVSVEKVEGQEKIERIVYPFLFRVTGKDILPDQKVYLLGMNHSFKEADYPPEALALIYACDLLLSEALVSKDSSKIRREWLMQENVDTALHVHKKLLSLDKEWREVLSAYKNATEEVDMDELISEIEEKKCEIKADQASWLDRLSLADQTKIQTILDEYGLHLKELDPLSVSYCLHLTKSWRILNYGDFEQGETAILNNFLKRNCPIIELESRLSGLTFQVDAALKNILDYDLESTLKFIHLNLEPEVEETDEIQQGFRKIQELADKVSPFPVPLPICEKNQENQKCVEFKTSEALKRHWSLVLEARKLGLLRSILADKIYFNFEEYEEKLLAIPSYTSWSMIYRNKTFYPKIPLAIQQKKDIAVICGAGHLIGETGIIRSLRRDGYDVNHVKDL